MKRIITIMLSFIIIIGCTACTATSSDSTKTIIDMSGSTVEVSRNIDKIACASVPGLDMLIAFGLGDKVIATHKDAYNSAWLDIFYPRINDLSVISSYEPEAESLIELNADIVFLPDPGVCESLRQKGVPAVCLRMYDTEEIRRAAEMLGEIFGEDVVTKATTWLSYMNTAITDIDGLLSDVPLDDRPVVYQVHGDKNKGLFRTGYGDAQGWLMYGGGQIATMKFEGATYGNFPTDEAVLETNPDVIFIDGAFWSQLYDELYNDEKWSNVTALREHKVYHIPMAFTSWCNYSIGYPLTIYYVFSYLYPDRVNFSMENKTKDFFNEFYSISLSEEQIVYMLSGLGPTGESLCQ